MYLMSSPKNSLQTKQKQTKIKTKTWGAISCWETILSLISGTQANLRSSKVINCNMLIRGFTTWKWCYKRSITFESLSGAKVTASRRTTHKPGCFKLPCEEMFQRNQGSSKINLVLFYFFSWCTISHARIIKYNCSWKKSQLFLPGESKKKDFSNSLLKSTFVVGA